MVKVRALFFRNIDWFLFAAALSISLLGLATMRSFSADNSFFEKQIIWIGISVVVFFIASIFDYGFLRRTPVIAALYSGAIFLLILVLSFGALVKGAQNRFDLGFFAFQPADPAKLILIALF